MFFRTNIFSNLFIHRLGKRSFYLSSLDDVRENRRIDGIVSPFRGDEVDEAKISPLLSRYRRRYHHLLNFTKASKVIHQSLFRHSIG